MLLHLRDNENKLVILEVAMIYYDSCVLNTTGNEIGCVVLETATNRTFAIPMNKEAYEQIFSCITCNHVYSIHGIKGIVLNSNCQGGEDKFTELIEINKENTDNINSDTVKVGIFDLTKGVNTMSNDKLQPYGWLAPDGEFIEADWGDHEGCAYEIILDNNWEDNYIDWTKHDKTNLNAGDFLCKEKGYVLIDDPKCEYYHVTYIKNLTKKQKEFLFDYFMAMDMKDRAYYYLNS